MATVRAYPNGVTMGTPSGVVPKGAKRGRVQGWTPESARRHIRWLYSVDVPHLTGHGWAVTLTVRELPASAAEWHAARRAWIERVRRRGLVRLHWVVEWQRRGVPHLHAAVYLDAADHGLGALLLTDWIAVCERRGWTALIRSQDVKPIAGATGWLQYLSKHAGRSAAHYQRMGMPAGWESSGRLWGHVGEWPTVEPVEGTLSLAAAARFRRLVDAYCRARARAEGDHARLAYLRRRRKAETDPYRSRVLGVSEWVPESVALRLLALVSEARGTPESV